MALKASVLKVESKITGKAGVFRLLVRYQRSPGEYSEYTLPPAVHTKDRIIAGPGRIRTSIRRRGLSRELVDRLGNVWREVARREGKKVVHVANVFAKNEVAKKFFEAMGYEKKGLTQTYFVYEKEYRPAVSKKTLSEEEKKIADWFRSKRPRLKPDVTEEGKEDFLGIG